MRNRQKFDYSKPFIFVARKQDFDLINSHQDQHQIEQAIKKQKQIILPEIDIVEPVNSIKSFAKITPNYIRLQAQFILPKSKHYQLTQLDIAFIQTNKQRYVFEGKKALTENLLKKVIIELELKAGRSMILPKHKGWLLIFLERQFNQLATMYNYGEFTDCIYNYWKSKREQAKFPLLRYLWKPEQHEYNHLMAFKSRNRQRRNLRKHHRLGQKQLMKQLVDQFNIALMATQRVVHRQKLKFKQVQLQILSFYYECSEYFTPPEFLDDFKAQDTAKDKETMYRYQCEMLQLRGSRQTQSHNLIIKQKQLQLAQINNRQNEYSSNRQIEQINNRELIQTNNILVTSTKKQQPDKKNSVINFLASVLYEAQAVGLNYSQIFVPHSIQSQTSKLFSNNKGKQQKTKLKSKIDMQKPKGQILEYKSLQQDQQSIRLYMQKWDGLVTKQPPISQNPSFDESAVQSNRSRKEYLTYMSRQISGSQIGSETSDQKDIKQSVSNSLKKFSMLQKLIKDNSTAEQ